VGSSCHREKGKRKRDTGWWAAAGVLLGWAGCWFTGLAKGSLGIRPELELGFCKYLNIGFEILFEFEILSNSNSTQINSK
jgi:hypothetical protein